MSRFANLDLQGSIVDAPLQSMNWMDVGEPPPEVAAFRAARLKTARSVGGVGGGIIIGGLAGFVVLTQWPGAFYWTFPSQVELFLAFAVPVGVAEFFVFRWMLTWLEKASSLHVRRVAILAGKLYTDQASGKSLERALKHVRLSKNAIAGGWFLVSLPAGRTALSFYVPPLVASTIASAMNQGPK